MAEALPFDHAADGIYIGGYQAIRFADALRAMSIRTVLKLYAGLPHFPADFNTLDHPTTDNELIPAAALQRGVDFISEQVRAVQPLLVMCSTGSSRSATFILAYQLAQGRDLHESFHTLRRAHPATELHPAMWLSLITHYKLAYTLAQVQGWGYENG